MLRDEVVGKVQELIDFMKENEYKCLLTQT